MTVPQADFWYFWLVGSFIPDTWTYCHFLFFLGWSHLGLGCLTMTTFRRRSRRRSQRKAHQQAQLTYLRVILVVLKGFVHKNNSHLAKGHSLPIMEHHGTNRWLSHLVLCFLWKVWGDAKPKSKAVKYLWEEPENQDMDDMVPSWGSSMHCSPKWCTLAECWTLRFFRVSWSIAWFYDRNSSDQSARTNRTAKSWKLPKLWIDSKK